MKKVLVSIKLAFEFVRCFPHLLLLYLHPNRKVIHVDLQRWAHSYHLNYCKPVSLIYLLSFYPEFRNLFYKRVGIIGKILNLFCPQMTTLLIASNHIGEGLFIQHGISTLIAAKSIGKNCWINQQVSIGYSSSLDQPVLKDNVEIYAGAKVIGNVTIGNNSRVGANAVVVKDVPDNCVVVGVPAYIIKRDGIKVFQKL